MKGVQILGSLSRAVLQKQHGPSHTGTTHLDPDPRSFGPYLALAFEFTMRVSVPHPVLPVLSEGCVACRHGEWRSAQLGSSDTIFDV